MEWFQAWHVTEERVMSSDFEEHRQDADGNILCEFCDEKAVYTNCRFWPATRDDSISGPFDLCQTHFDDKSNTEGSTGDEELIDV